MCFVANSIYCRIKRGYNLIFFCPRKNSDYLIGPHARRQNMDCLEILSSYILSYFEKRLCHPEFKFNCNNLYDQVQMTVFDISTF
jgi:hypothetical protein